MRMKARTHHPPTCILPLRGGRSSREVSLPPHEGEGEDGGTFGAMTSIIVTYNAISENDKSRSPLGFLLLV